MAGLTGCNPLPNNQQPEPQKITQESSTTQEQIDSRIIFARDYPEIFAVLKGREYKLEITSKGATIQFPETVTPTDPIVKQIADTLEQKGIKSSIAVPFLFGLSPEKIKTNKEGVSISISNDIFERLENNPEPKPNQTSPL